MPELRPEVKQAIGNYFSGVKPASATVLLGLLLKLYGTPVLNWQPETIQLEVKDDLGVEMPTKVYDKLMALISAMTTDAAYSDVMFFDEFVSAINGRGYGQDDDMPSVLDVCKALVELQLNDPEPPSTWSNNIKLYCGVILADEGMSIPPAVMSFAKGKFLRKEGTDDNSQYAAAWQGKQDKATEIDQLCEKHAISIIGELMDAGINVTN